MPVPDLILEFATGLGRSRGATIASEIPLPGSADLSDADLAQIEARHGSPLTGVDLCEVEQAYSAGLIGARCEQGVIVRFDFAGQPSSVTLKGGSDDVLAAALTLATTPPTDVTPTGLRALLEPALGSPIVLVPTAGPPITLSPP